MINDRLGLQDRILAGLGSFFNELTQVVNGIQKSVIKLGDFALDIAWYGKINQKHRPMFALLNCPLNHAQTDDRQRAGGTAHNNIELVHA